MDIGEILSSLSDEDMEKIKNVASAVMNNEKQDDRKNDVSLLMNTDMLSGLSKISTAFSKDDERTALIKALKPMLGEDKQQKADEAIKILKLINLIPLLRESGLLSGLL